MRISYIIHHGYAEMDRFKNDGDRSLNLSFTPEYSGTLLLGAKRFPVKNGEVIIPLTELDDGEYSPRLVTEQESFLCEELCKRGTDIYVPKVSEETLHRLIRRCRELETKTDDLAKKMEKLESLCFGHNIFNFERKKNETQA